MKVEAMFYAVHEDYVQCGLCPHLCRISDGKAGACRCRINEKGKLWTTNYGRTTSIALDPIEKKPLYHYYPGRQIISIAPNSCNMRCPFCQNWEISQENTTTQFMGPDTLVKIMQDHGSFGVSYTYTEPFTWYEYLLDAGQTVRRAGGKNVLVTNGMINEEPLRRLIPIIDAMNIDLKSVDEKIYSETLYGDLKTVQNTIRIAREHCHVEITNLLVTGLNDGEKDIDKLIDYVVAVDPTIPLHFSRYYPNYRYDQPPTPVKRLEYAHDSARKKGMFFVYLGNVPSEDGSCTFCPKCGNLLIERMNYQSLTSGLKKDKCRKCGAKINIVA